MGGINMNCYQWQPVEQLILNCYSYLIFWMCLHTDRLTDRTHHNSIISCRPCTVVVGQRNLVVSFIKHDSLAVCLAPGCRLTSDELLQGSVGWKQRLCSCSLTASIGMFLPLQTSQPKRGANSLQSAALNEAGVKTTLHQLNEISV